MYLQQIDITYFSILSWNLSKIKLSPANLVSKCKNRWKNWENSGIIGLGDENLEILPNADKAVIPIEKFTKYALNHEKQRDKAIAFQQALGYNLSNYQKLIDNIKYNLKNYPAIPKPDLGYGIRYEVIMFLLGENNKRAKVLTAWIVDNATQETRLISTYIDE